MIAEFSSLIELSAALYLTISLDDLLLKRFWTPNYRKEIETKLGKIKELPSIAGRVVVSKADTMSYEEENKSRKRGALLFSLTVFLLLVSGFEEQFVTGMNELYSSAVGTMVLLFLVVYMLDGVLLRSWWGVLVFSIAIPLGCLLGGMVVTKSSPKVVSFLNVHQFDEILLMALLPVALLAPILWQLFRNWLYSRYYLDYLVKESRIKAEEYHTAVNCDPKKGHRMTNVEKVYQDAVGVALASGNQDRLIKPFLDILQSQLSQIEYVPTIIPLIKYSFSITKKPRLSNKRFNKLYTEYSNMQKPPKLDVFCKEKGIDYDLFHSMYLQRRKG